MADQPSPVSREELQPPAEVVHLPGPSYIPVVVALGLTLIIAGIVITWIISIIGAIIFLVATVRWIRETRQDIAELPLEH
jgi:hypothetical protein